MTETIAQRLRRLLDEARAAGVKVSAKSLSLAVGGGETYIGDILRGRVRNPSMAKLSRIAKHLKVPLERLVPDDEPAYPDLHEAPSPFGAAPARPLLDPESLSAILAALPHALKRLPYRPTAERTSEAIYRAQGWFLDESAAGRPPASDAVVNFLSHIL
jgi:transcriptional regulator with XRE-family HTH domain